MDTDGTQYVIPIEAKTAEEPLGLIQIASLNAFAQDNFLDLTLQSVAIKFWSDASIFFAAFNQVLDCDDIEVTNFKRYRLIRDEHLAEKLGLQPEDRSDG